MSARSLMDILAGKPFYVFIPNLTAKPVDLPKLMIVASASNARSSIVHARDVDPCITKVRGRALLQCNATNSVHLVCYQSPERRDEQMDRHNAVKELD